MRCIIPNQNVKIVSRAIHSFSKIGDEVFIKSTENELVFKTVNMAHSALVEFKMSARHFFSTYTFGSGDENIVCKVTMRSCCSVFRNAHSMEKQVESCEMKIKPNGNVVIFQMKFTNSHIKKYYLPILEPENVQAGFTPEGVIRLMASSKFFSSVLKNFRHSEEEITIIVEKEKAVMKNHIEIRRETFLRTELCYHPTEFEIYQVENANPVSITFCFKELRAVLAFAEPSNLPVLMMFSSAGNPILFQVKNNPAYEANYVVATLVPLNSSARPAPAWTTSASQSSSDSEPVRRQSLKRPRVESPTSSVEENAAPGPSNDLQQMEVDSDPGRNNVTNDPFEVPWSVYSNNPARSPMTTPTSSESAKNPSPPTPSLSPGVVSVYGSSSSLFGKDGTSNSSIKSPSPSPSRILSTTGLESRNVLMKTVFSRCYSNYNLLSQLSGHDKILAESSDEEMA